MRRPWVPMIQSSGEGAGWKLRRKVTVTDNEGSSLIDMGEKRVSSKALAFAGGGVRFFSFLIYIDIFFSKKEKGFGGRGELIDV